MPAFEVQGPAFLTPAPTVQVAAAAPETATAPAAEVASPAGAFPATEQSIAPAPVDWFFWGYAAPAALLLLLTLIALGRLFALKTRASVLVDPHWLSALAHAQRRMGFKHGTALLTSDDLPSPISWGVMRPVILLNSGAIESKREAEAIIAHELAHVASLDWAKLLLARVTVALFWFNPLVWVLAREAHQLREEAADDAVLQSDIVDTDYANLLVGVARHECRGMLIGAHGVAPGKHSLTRRVRRVLDGPLARAPGGWRWTSAAAFFAAGVAVPVAMLEFVSPTAANAAAAGRAIVGSAASAERFHSQERPTAISRAAAEVAASAVATATMAADQFDPRDIAARVADQFDADMHPEIDVHVDADVDIDSDERTLNMPVGAGGIIHSPDPVETISMSGGGEIVVRYGRSHQVRMVRGSGANVSVSDGSLSVQCTGNCGNVSVEVTTPRVEALAIQGGGVIRVAGGFPRMPELALAIHGGGRIDARMLPATSVAAATRGGGTILTTAESDLAASTSGGGEIRYWGTQNVATSIQGGGHVTPGG
jgi:beta-lactamase regulating signal transducer with metallopeptidase domain